jgi:hypothetical protein
MERAGVGEDRPWFRISAAMEAGLGKSKITNKPSVFVEACENRSGRCRNRSLAAGAN